MVLWEEPKKRTRIGKIEWEAIKRSYGYKCVIGGEEEKRVGELQQAHIKPLRKGGRAVIPMCPTCHKKHDKGLLSPREWRKLYATKQEYQRSIATKAKKKDEIERLLGG